VRVASVGLEMGADREKVRASGLPNIVKSPNYFAPLIYCVAVQAIAIGIGYAVLFASAGAATYSGRIAKVIENEQHWTFAAAALIGFAVRFVNIYPMVHKSMIMTSQGSEDIGINLRSNPFIYKAIGAGAAVNSVVFDNEGHVGKYNRANRSLHHMVENFGSVLVGLCLSGTIFPFPTFVSAVSFSLGRMIHQIGYTFGYGGHALGFVLATLGSASIEGMLSVVALEAFGVLPALGVA